MDTIPVRVVRRFQVLEVGFSFGLELVADVSEDEHVRGVFIRKISKDHEADFGWNLEVGDQLLELDDKNLVGVSYERVIEIFTSMGEVVTVFFEKLKQNKPTKKELQAMRQIDYEFEVNRMVFSSSSHGSNEEEFVSLDGTQEEELPIQKDEKIAPSTFDNDKIDDDSHEEQNVNTEDREDRESFIQQQVFPGGTLTSPGSLPSLSFEESSIVGPVSPPANLDAVENGFRCKPWMIILSAIVFVVIPALVAPFIISHLLK